MTIYFQHVGEAGAKRDFPRTIGTADGGLKHFSVEDIAQYIDGFDEDELRSQERAILKQAPHGFQIWGLPSGAKSILRNITDGDYLLLLEGAKPSGVFGYGGRVVYKTISEQFRLSVALWGEAKFPVIVFLDSSLSSFPWVRFVEEFGFSANWNPAGQSYRLRQEKIAASTFRDEATAVAWIIYGGEPSTSAPEAEEDHFTDAAELDVTAAEGKQVLIQHLKRERSRHLVSLFEKTLTDFACTICGFDFEATYGQLGKTFIEAHHCKPIAMMKAGERTAFHDLAGVCSNCHRMLHRTYPALTVEELRSRFRQRRLT